MLTPYPLEPPPPLPPLDEPWEGDDPPLRSGRRLRIVGEGRFAFGPGGSFERMGRATAGERWCVALEEPCLLWEGAGTLRGALRVDDDDLHVEQAADGTTIWIAGETARREFLIGCRGGTLEVVEIPGGVQVVATGPGVVRLIVVAADDEADRDRTLRTLARKGLPGLRTQRVQHAERVAGYGARLVTPDVERNVAFAALLHDTDARLIEKAGGRRALASPLVDGTALLALGLREQVRDVLRTPVPNGELLRLFAAYADWAGDDEFVRKQWPRVEQAARIHGDPGVALVLLPVAEALGDHAAIAALDGLSTGAVPSVPAPLPDALETLWGVRPDALARNVTLHPSLPNGWREMTLERLRVGATTLAAKAVRRPGVFALKLQRTHGPAITVRLAPRLSFTPAGVFAQEEPLSGPEVTFVLNEDGEVRWME